MSVVFILNPKKFREEWDLIEQLPLHPIFLDNKEYYIMLTDEESGSFGSDNLEEIIENNIEDLDEEQIQELAQKIRDKADVYLNYDY